MEIVSNVAGRARFRDPALKREPRLEEAQRALAALPGVSAVEANVRVGSLLVHYDPALAALESLAQAVGARAGAAAEAGRGAAPRPRSRRAAEVPRRPGAPLVDRRVLKNLGLLATLSVSMGGALFHLKKLHYLSGLAFVALSGDHVLERKRALIS